MRLERFTLLAITLISILSSACGGITGTANNAGSNNTSPKTNGNIAPVNSVVETTKKPEAALSNAAPTLAPVVQAYYESLKKKDDLAVSEVMSIDYLKRTQANMKAEKKKGVALYLVESGDSIPDKPIEVRNEKIEGNTAVAEIRGGAYLNWTAFAFINEGGKWKLTGGGPDIDTVKKSSFSPNAAK